METKGLDCLARIYISIGLITKNYIMENIEIFEKHFKKGMSNKDFASFKRTHPTLLKVVTRAMEEVEKEGELYKKHVLEQDVVIYKLEQELLSNRPQEETKYHPTPIQEVDSILSRLEDHLHGKSGTDVTIARKILSELPMYIVDRPQVSEQLKEIHSFLLGESALNEKWFGDKDADGKQFWWRSNLRVALLATAPNNKEEQPKVINCNTENAELVNIKNFGGTGAEQLKEDVNSELLKEARKQFCIPKEHLGKTPTPIRERRSE